MIENQETSREEIAPHNVLASLAYGVITTRADHTIQSVNAAGLEQFGYDEPDLLGAPLQTLFEQPGGHGAALLVTGNFRAVRKDGSVFSAELVMTPLKGSPSGQLVASVRNIEAELQRENHYRLLVETSEIPQFVMNQDGFMYANQAAARVYGFDSVEDLVNLHPTAISPEFQPDGRDSASKSNEMIGLAFEKGIHRFEWMNIKKDGTEVWMDLILTRLPHMGTDALFVACHDITERAKTEKFLRRSQKMDAIGQLTGGIAHDFNNILGIVMGNLEILQRSLTGNSSATQRIKAALNATSRAAKITNKLLTFSNENVCGARRITINEPIQDFHALMSKSLTAAIIIKLELAQDLWQVDVDPDEFGDAILNLALNARDAMPDGGKLTIQTANKALDSDYVKGNAGASTGDFVMITISDTGIGMSEDVQEKVFEPFFTTKAEGKGTGLGMSMVYGFIKRSGGHVKISSQPDNGTTIRIYLPRADMRTKMDAPLSAMATETPRGTETVLIVDDETALLETSVNQLTDLGYQTLTASSGQQALDIMAERRDIDLVFSDVVMPGPINGFQLGAQIIEKYPTVKVLLASGFTRRFGIDDDDNPAQIIDLSASLLRKPYNQYELAIAIRKTLGTAVT